ncbi:hypothetical protein ABS642_00805 [Microbacterium sp. A8/3-1]|uniref:Uncharacterized protein n=1 Tax=Microbacterium sp. A8/3-1 TaxID=3160749 RepID=A0AAU7VW60_9MICO
MTYLAAAEHAERAAKAARSAKASAEDRAEKKIAESLLELSLAVKELAEAGWRDN